MTWDCLIVGGGPAGLTAATYLGRYRRKVLLVDAGNSRASGIPASHNHPGFGSGIAGSDLLKRLRAQAQRYHVELRKGKVHSLRQASGAFLAQVLREQVRAERVLLATGIEDVTPDLPGLEKAVAQAVVRYCPICDGYEALDKNIAVLGPLDRASKEAAFLRTYSKSVTILLVGAPDASPCREELADSGIDVTPFPPRELRPTRSGITVELENGELREFDVLYPALGCTVHSDLAEALGARCNAIGCIEVDQKQRTSVDGLYAAGDVVSDLHQISVAEGHAAIAATAIHKSLPRNLR